MRATLPFWAFFIFCKLFAQNQPFYNNPNYYTTPLILNKQLPDNEQNYEIYADQYKLTITNRVLYNATPDGYHVTYSKTFFSESEAAIEPKLNQATDELIKAVAPLNISQEDILVDIVAFDPMFNFKMRDTGAIKPDGYKITENITFSIKDIASLRRLTRICAENSTYDMVRVQPFINNSMIILDSIAEKSVEVLNLKKKYSEKVGWKMEGGHVSFKERNDVIYPSERYLMAVAQNQNPIYQYQISQNGGVAYNRVINSNNSFDYNHKQADFVFNL